jgi:hypothetical protein
VIDEVHYHDSAPWPPQADGNGPHLKLIDINLDNSLPQNWIASNDQLVSTGENMLVNSISIFPNPMKNYAQINSSEAVSFVELLDVSGRIMLKTIANGQSELVLDLSSLPAQTYILKVVSVNGNTSFHKLNKL